MDIKELARSLPARDRQSGSSARVRIDPLFQAPEPAFGQGASVTFEPGARTAWHTHPLVQTLIETADCGWAQRWGGAVELLDPLHGSHDWGVEHGSQVAG
jgi:quercetin dioxygenase-like cupin family protein